MRSIMSPTRMIVVLQEELFIYLVAGMAGVKRWKSVYHIVSSIEIAVLQEKLFQNRIVFIGMEMTVGDGRALANKTMAKRHFIH